MHTITVRSNSLLLIGALALLLASGCATPRPAQRPGGGVPSAAAIDDADAPGYRIKSGDRVTVQIPELDIDTTVTVGPTGHFNIPPIGEVQAAGTTKDELTSSLTARGMPLLQERSKITVTVSVKNQMAQLMTVLGAVGNQGVFPLTGEVPVIQAIATAGGSTVESDLRHIKLFKKGRYDEPIEVDLTTNLSTGNLSGIPLVGPGDTVFIPREENVIRELSGFFRDVIFLFGILGFFQ